jgi:hypothetical protein
VDFEIVGLAVIDTRTTTMADAPRITDQGAEGKLISAQPRPIRRTRSLALR